MYCWLSFMNPEQITVRLVALVRKAFPIPQLDPCLCCLSRTILAMHHVLADNSTVAQHTTFTTLHHLTPDTHCLLLCLSLFLSWRRLSPFGRTDTVLTTCTGTNSYLCPSTQIRGACGTRSVEVRHQYTLSMFTHRDHSEYNPSRSPEHPDPYVMPINRGLASPFKYGQFFLAKALPPYLLISVITDLSIIVLVADTPLASPLLRRASFLQVTRRRVTVQDQPRQVITLGVVSKVFGINILALEGGPHAFLETTS
ncbi:hypothetical protein TIFTF001_015418 [Ficus carica]|uniref:Uncharacterized protein n=1 Tax=Ficus carica TaxID=3494 RepID=A0AA87ZYM4_FICCA|nr:hypothetical protein TIFTF001_015418 [Ficus carica]